MKKHTFTLERVQGVNGCRRLYKSSDGKLFAEITSCDSWPKLEKDSLMNQWVKRGFIEEWMSSYLSVNTYFYSDDGKCFGYYNPQINEEHYDPRTIEYEAFGGSRKVVDFRWKLGATPENEEAILNEIQRRYDNDERIYHD